MLANADSVRFKVVYNVHLWAYMYFEKLPVSRKTYFLQKVAYGLGQGISCMVFLVVSHFEASFN